MNETRLGVQAIGRDLEEHRLYVNQRLSNLEENMKDDLGQRLEDHMVDIHETMLATQSVVERGLNESMATVNDNIEESLTDHLTQTCAKVMSVNSELEQNILTNITKQLKTTSQSPQEALGPCGGEGWTRVAYLDMTDPNTTCPSGWQLTGQSKRTCGKVSTDSLTCDSVFFPVSGGAYTSVCGRIKGYQNSRTDAFESYHNGQATTIDEPYAVSHMAVHGNTSGHLQPVLQAVILTLKPVPVILQLISLPHHLWVEITSVNPESIQGHQEDSFQMILCGMEIFVLLAVYVVHSTILHISPRNSPTLPLMIWK